MTPILAGGFLDPIFQSDFFRSDLPDSDFQNPIFRFTVQSVHFPTEKIGLQTQFKIGTKSEIGTLREKSDPKIRRMIFQNRKGPRKIQNRIQNQIFQPLYKSAQIVQRIENRSWAGQSAPGCGAARGYSGFR